MKNILCYSLFMLLTSIGFAQSSFEQGYYINTKGVKVEGYLELINFEKINSTEKLYFKKELKDEVVKVSINEIVEFGVGAEIKYQKHTFEMDDVSLFKDFNNEKDLNVKSVTLFLNVLIEGEVSLYEYDGDNGAKYFYSEKSKGSNIVQLVYKKYIVSGESIKENNAFKEQLFKNIKTEDQTFNEFVSLKYDKQQLLPLFKKYNESKSSNYVVYKNKFKKEGKIRVTGFVGINQFNSEFNGFGIGGEGEFVFPSETTAIYAKVRLESLDSNDRHVYTSGGGTTFNEDLYDAKSILIDLFFGFRYYVKINAQNKFFINAGGGLNLAKTRMDHTQNLIIGSDTFQNHYSLGSSESDLFGTVGFGYVYKRIGVEFEYDTKKMIYSNNTTSFDVKYGKMGINLRYTFY